MATFRLAIFLICPALFLGSQASFAVDKQPKDDAAAMLSKAAGLVDLQASGAAPFLLLTKVVLREGNKSVDGVFATTWAAPGQYRRVFRFPGFTATEVAAEGATYDQRSTEALTLMVWELEQLLDLAPSYRLSPKTKIRRIRTEHSGAIELTCVSTQGSAPTDLTDSKICVNAATGEPFSIDRGIDAYGLESLHEHFEFSEYQPFEGRTFPRKLTFRGWGSRVVEVQVQKLIRARSFPADEFTPPKAATKTSFCGATETAGDLMPSSKSTIPVGFKDVEVDMYFQVTSAGGVRSAQVVYSSDPLHNDEILNWFIGTHFPIKTCSGTPIAYETMVRMFFGH